jgi:chromosome segregation ATPase
MTEKEAKVRAQAKEAVEKLKEKLKSATEGEAASKARVAELEGALSGVGSESAQDLDLLRRHLAESSASGIELQAQLSEMTEKEAKVRAQAKEAVEKLKEAASKARVAELESALQSSDSTLSQQVEALTREISQLRSSSSDHEGSSDFFVAFICIQKFFLLILFQLLWSNLLLIWMLCLEKYF